MDERFSVRVPPERPIELHRDIPQVACTHAAMLALDIRDGNATRHDAVEEVPHVVNDGVEFPGSLRSLQIVEVVHVQRFAWQRISCEILDRFALDRRRD